MVPEMAMVVYIYVKSDCIACVGAQDVAENPLILLLRSLLPNYNHMVHTS